ncbi:DDE-type integrase/transposase/recombinase [Metapseudomonas furukawaii]|uniref:Mu transposase C-terminal domain-containing protein n=1 Tax=Metapseudomonas furukawaii TaxID=1149133 RepID=UPI00227A0F68|nr:Mu transposase C-terminal domain-containing protein [Pseudomonas furukawaii]WAG76572.1 DDE-type integrase/transposase/recombinase [Pseudomonas furukawaii]
MSSVELREGLVVVAKGIVCVVTKFTSLDNISVISQKEGKRFIVPFDEIEFFPAVTDEGVALIAPELDELARNASDDEITLAESRFDVIGRYSCGEISLAEALVTLEMSRSNFYRLKKNYSEEIGMLSLLRYNRGNSKGALKLTDVVERYIQESIDEVYSGSSASISKVWSDVEAKCISSGNPLPSMTAVRKRIKMRDEKELYKKKHGADAASQKHDARPGKKIFSRPLERVQMDHTLVDVILVDNVRRQPLGRPWLTVIIDQYTRVILGYYLSLHSPSAVSVSSAIYHAALPKFSFLQKLGVDVERYPYYGVPEIIHMDNAKEFRSKKFESACIRNKIKPEWRPIGKKHYGGHVERLIGTFMTGKVHFLPGTTFSNVVKRRGHNSDKASALTFKEFTKWFVKEVCIYHGRKHSELGCSPGSKWAEYFGAGGDAPMHPPIVSNPFKFKLDFMPEVTRSVSPQGIEFKKCFYWDAALRLHVGKAAVMIKYDPFSLGTIWAYLDGEYLPVHFSDVTKSDFSLEEYHAQKMQGRGEGHTPAGGLEDRSLAEYVHENKELVKRSQSETRRARKAEAARSEYLSSQREESNEIDVPVDKTDKADRPNYSRRATPFKGKNYD